MDPSADGDGDGDGGRDGGSRSALSYGNTPSPINMDFDMGLDMSNADDAGLGQGQGQGQGQEHGGYFSLKGRGVPSHPTANVTTTAAYADPDAGHLNSALTLLELEGGGQGDGLGQDDSSPLCIDGDDFELDEEVELMLHQHDDPSMAVLYMETRRRSQGTVCGGGSSQDNHAGGADDLLLEGLDDDDDDVQPIAPRRDSVDSPNEDWDTMLGMEDEIRDAQQEMASGFRFLIGIDKPGSPKGGAQGGGADGAAKAAGDDDNGLESFLSDQPTTIQSTPVRKLIYLPCGRLNSHGVFLIVVLYSFRNWMCV
jgi:hypothetical protein